MVKQQSSLKAAYDEQRQHYERLCRANLATLYVCLERSDKYREAEGYYTAAIESDENELRELEEAIQREAARIPEQIYIRLVRRYSNLGELYRLRGRYEEAFKGYEKALILFLKYSKQNVCTRMEISPVLYVFRANLQALPGRIITRERKEGLVYRATDTARDNGKRHCNRGTLESLAEVLL